MASRPESFPRWDKRRLACRVAASLRQGVKRQVWAQIPDAVEGVRRCDERASCATETI